MSESDRLIENLYDLQFSHYNANYLSKEEIKNELQYI
jgi:hypothetical protein